ncbi:hypothetical protein P389DRAFT_167607 [Cystobasidium minutum MCA 4210]|uniref:uncharacterized protein n=1 Tax=Cystobasidium minutum MCA 4210 TaxID=1397322 RepID=UPI0034CF4B79|eukprot:jgi/Rhomi1/167607/fgenesh1_kg.2_\
MPWPYISSRSKATSTSYARPGTSAVSDRDVVGDDALIGGLSLEEDESTGGNSQQSTTRRGASLDIPRASLNALTPFTASQASSSKARRSSFPRLALPSWRQQQQSQSQQASPSLPASSSSLKHKASTSSPSSRSLHSRRSSRRTSLALDDGSDNDDDDENQGVELQEGYGTPYTATGLKGGFQLCNPAPSNTLSGSSSIASTSSSSRKSQSSNLFSLLSGTSSASTTRTSSDEYSLEGHSLKEDGAEDEHTAERSAMNGGSRWNGNSKPSDIIHADSGFSEFGPDTVIEQEEVKRLRSALVLDGGHEATARNVTMHPSTSSQGDYEGDDSNDTVVAVPKKARSRGWFSFNSTSKQSATDTSSGADDTTTTTSTSSSTPKNEGEASAASLPMNDPRAEVRSSSGSSDLGATSKSSQQPVSKANDLAAAAPSVSATSPNKKPKQSTPSKGFSIMRSAGRKRGDSEVSMKEMTTLS